MFLVLFCVSRGKQNKIISIVFAIYLFYTFENKEITYFLNYTRKLENPLLQNIKKKKRNVVKIS